MDKLYIGIDPGTNTGLAYHLQGKLTVKTSTFWEVYHELLTLDPKKVKVFIEIPPSKFNWHSKGMIASANVGIIYQESRLLAKGLKLAGFNVTECRPAGKLTAAKFKALTGFSNRTNSHTRDAAMLAIKGKKNEI